MRKAAVSDVPPLPRFAWEPMPPSSPQPEQQQAGGQPNVQPDVQHPAASAPQLPAQPYPQQQYAPPVSQPVPVPDGQPRMDLLFPQAPSAPPPSASPSLDHLFPSAPQPTGYPSPQQQVAPPSQSSQPTGQPNFQQYLPVASPVYPQPSAQPQPAQRPIGQPNLDDLFPPSRQPSLEPPAQVAAPLDLSGQDGIAQLLGAFPATAGFDEALDDDGVSSRRSRRGVQHEPPGRAGLAVIALVTGIAAFALSLYQPFAIFAIVPAVAAIALAIVAVARRGARRALATVGLVVAALAVPIAALSYSAGLQPASNPNDLAAAHSSSEPSDSPDPSPSASASTPAEEAPVVATPPVTTVRDARLGGTAKDSRGVSFTLQAVNCGLDDAGGTAPQSGQQFCAVQFAAVNRGSATVTLSSSDISLVRGDSAFWATVADFGGSSSAAVGPGASASGTFYVEVPAGVRPEFATLGAGANFTL